MDLTFDRKKGCMYGLAIGDALGAAVEFKSPGDFEPITGYCGDGPHGLLPGQWTDDTSMALALADSIGSVGWDLKDQLERYCKWYKDGKYSINNICFDIGNTTRKALNNFLATGETNALGIVVGTNGSIMRLAPVVIKYLDDPNLLNYVEESSKTTHTNLFCIESCKMLGQILRDFIWGREEIDISKDDYPLIGNIIDECKLEEINIPSMGLADTTLKAAMWSFAHSKDFEETVLKAVNLGGDTDTIGAVAGQIAGAYWGYSSIPQHLIDGLSRKDKIDKYLTPIL